MFLRTRAACVRAGTRGTAGHSIVWFVIGDRQTPAVESEPPLTQSMRGAPVGGGEADDAGEGSRAEHHLCCCAVPYDEPGESVVWEHFLATPPVISLLDLPGT